MGANSGIAALIGTIVLVVIGLMMLGLVEDGVTDALTESKSVTGAAVSVQEAVATSYTLTGQTSTFSGGVKSWYANKRIDNDASKLVLPPGYGVSVSVTGATPERNAALGALTATCASPGWLLTDDRTGLQCASLTVTSAENGVVATANTITVTPTATILLEKAGDDATALGIFKIAPFLFLLGGILLTMVATAFTSVVNSGTSIRDVIIRAVIIFVGFMLITTITQSLTDAREVFSYAVEYTGMSGGFSLVILLYAITLIIGLIGTARAGYGQLKQGKEGGM